MDQFYCNSIFICLPICYLLRTCSCENPLSPESRKTLCLVSVNQADTLAPSTSATFVTYSKMWSYETCDHLWLRSPYHSGHSLFSEEVWKSHNSIPVEILFKISVKIFNTFLRKVSLHWLTRSEKVLELGSSTWWWAIIINLDNNSTYWPISTTICTTEQKRKGNFEKNEEYTCMLGYH